MRRPEYEDHPTLMEQNVAKTMPVSKFRHTRVQVTGRRPILGGHIPSSAETAKETNIATVLDDATAHIAQPRPGIFFLHV